MLISKPLLERMRAVHDYHADTITITDGVYADVIKNASDLPYPNISPPSTVSCIHTLPITTDLTGDFQDVGLIDLEDALSDGNIDAPNVLFTADNQIFTRLTELGPYYPPQVDAIVNAVSIGLLADEQHAEAIALIHEFADIFALSVREVKPVDFLRFHLNIPKNKSYSTKVSDVVGLAWPESPGLGLA